MHVTPDSLVPDMNYPGGDKKGKIREAPASPVAGPAAKALENSNITSESTLKEKKAVSIAQSAGTGKPSPNEQELPEPGSSRWQPRALSIVAAMQKMLKNAKKGIEEHLKKDPEGIYATVQEALPSNDDLVKVEEKPLLFSYQAHEDKGKKRPKMEDAHFYTELPQGICAGVFDGHGGRSVSNFASSEFKKKFPKALKEANGNVHQAFEALIDKIHKKVAKKKDWNLKGTTAVITFVDKNTHLIYTATIGDSEANIYRNFGSGMKSIPLSVIRDWTSKSDATRAARFKQTPGIVKEYMGTSNPKWLRFPNALGVNVSRAIGDVSYGGTPQNPGVVHKPKITVNKAKPNDVLILACDGLKDFVNENEIVNKITNASTDPKANLAKNLVQYALEDKKSKDNVTVVVIKIN